MIYTYKRKILKPKNKWRLIEEKIWSESLHIRGNISKNKTDDWHSEIRFFWRCKKTSFFKSWKSDNKDKMHMGFCTSTTKSAAEIVSWEYSVGQNWSFSLQMPSTLRNLTRSKDKKISSLKCHLQGAWFLCNANSHIKYAGMWISSVWMGRGNWFTNSEWNRNLRARVETKQLLAWHGVNMACNCLFLWELLWLLCCYNIIKVLSSVIEYQGFYSLVILRLV